MSVYDIEQIIKKRYSDIFEFEELLKNNSPSYKTLAIEKKNGNFRLLSIPRAADVLVQEHILNFLHKENLDFLPCVTAFRGGISILDNAKSHIGNNFLIHYDLRDFFDTIHRKRVKEELTKRNVNPTLIKIIMKWCFHNGHLPQGAATSPFLANLVCENLDRRFSVLAKKIDAIYTRYADDIIISGKENILNYQTIYKKIIRTEKFFINHSKTRISVLDKTETRKNFPNQKFFVPYHIITGLAVNENRVFVRPSYLSKIWDELKAGEITASLLGKISFVNFIDSIEGSKLCDYVKNKLEDIPF